jgi:Zn-finger nucleic acid-binding protein
MELTCPKCHGAMRTYERNGVHVDQCADCRGIFLDRGELDRLVDAETAWHGGGRAEKRPDDHDRQQENRSSGSDFGTVVSDVLSQVRGTRQSPSGHGYPKRKKESFLGDLFG